MDILKIEKSSSVYYNSSTHTIIGKIHFRGKKLVKFHLQLLFVDTIGYDFEKLSTNEVQGKIDSAESLSYFLQELVFEDGLVAFKSYKFHKSQNFSPFFTSSS